MAPVHVDVVLVAVIFALGTALYTDFTMTSPQVVLPPVIFALGTGFSFQAFYSGTWAYRTTYAGYPPVPDKSIIRSPFSFASAPAGQTPISIHSSRPGKFCWPSYGSNKDIGSDDPSWCDQFTVVGYLTWVGLGGTVTACVSSWAYMILLRVEDTNLLVSIPFRTLLLCSGVISATAMSLASLIGGKLFTNASYPNNKGEKEGEEDVKGVWRLGSGWTSTVGSVICSVAGVIACAS